MPVLVQRLEGDWTGLSLCAGSKAHLRELNLTLDRELRLKSEALCTRQAKRPQLVGELERESLCLPTVGPRTRYFGSVMGRFVCVE